MSDPPLTSRIFVLGAGFSAPAGLPLSRDLLTLALTELDGVGHSDHLHSSRDKYLAYKVATEGTAPDPVDIEDFAAFLDYEHFLGLLGSDGWSGDGNRAQLQLRWGIGRVIHRLTPASDRMPSAYLKFAARLRPPDMVITFNYDRILEGALERVGIPYRRFPWRQRLDPDHGLVVDSGKELTEVLLVKPHGSVDWISTTDLRRSISRYEGEGRSDFAEYLKRTDPVFGAESVSRTHPLVEGPTTFDDPMADVQVIDDLKEYYNSPNALYFHAPMILAPSSAKQLYGATLAPLWSGLDGYGRSGLTVIGYSLPAADPYARQALYDMVRSYLFSRRSEERLGHPGPMALISLKSTPEAIAALRETYRLMPESDTRFFMDGFSEAAVEWTFQADQNALQR